MMPFSVLGLVRLLSCACAYAPVLLGLTAAAGKRAAAHPQELLLLLLDFTMLGYCLKEARTAVLGDELPSSTLLQAITYAGAQ